MERWKIKALKLVDEILDNEGPQTHKYLYSSLVKKHSKKGYSEVSHNVSSHNIRSLLKQFYPEVGLIFDKRSSNYLTLWGPRT